MLTSRDTNKYMWKTAKLLQVWLEFKNATPPLLVEEKPSKICVWKQHYFVFKVDVHAVIINEQNSVCKRCHQSFQMKEGNTLYLVKFLKEVARFIYFKSSRWVSCNLTSYKVMSCFPYLDIHVTLLLFLFLRQLALLRSQQLSSKQCLQCLNAVFRLTWCSH